MSIISEAASVREKYRGRTLRPRPIKKSRNIFEGLSLTDIAITNPDRTKKGPHQNFRKTLETANWLFR